MIYTLNDEVCTKNNLKTEEVLAILLVTTGADIAKLFNSLEERKIIVKSGLFGNYLVTQRWADTVSTILLDSDENKQSPDRIDNLAIRLMEIFPKCKKSGTCHYFRGNRKDVSLKLKKFFKLYGDKYTDEQILNAARQYVKSFNGDYSYMRILKYFIWKDEKKINADGKAYIEETSDLASCIENEGQEEYKDDWQTTLR